MKKVACGARWGGGSAAALDTPRPQIEPEVRIYKPLVYRRIPEVISITLIALILPSKMLYLSFLYSYAVLFPHCHPHLWISSFIMTPLMRRDAKQLKWCVARLHPRTLCSPG